MWVYRQMSTGSEEWLVGWHNESGRWIDADKNIYESAEEAARRCNYLNGGEGNLYPSLEELEERSARMKELLDHNRERLASETENLESLKIQAREDKMADLLRRRREAGDRRDWPTCDELDRLIDLMSRS